MRCINCDCCHEGVCCEWNSMTCQYENVSKYYCWGVPEPFEIKDANVECTEYPEKRGDNMSIVEENGNVRVEYHIPAYIKSAIPEDFYFVFLGFVFGILGMPDKNELGEYLCYMDGTAGWYKAFTKTCALFDIPWLKEYYDSLEWYDSDWFDGEIADEIEKRLQ